MVLNLQKLFNTFGVYKQYNFSFSDNMWGPHEGHIWNPYVIIENRVYVFIYSGCIE